MFGVQLVEPGFVDRAVAIVDRGDGGFVDVDIDDVGARIRKAGRNCCAYVAAANDADVHYVDSCGRSS